MIFAVLRAMRGSRPDGVWCGHLHLAPLAALLAWRWRVPMWLQVHGVEAWQQPSALRRWAAEYAQMITAVSRHTRRELLRWWRGAPERVRVLPNTVADAFVPTATNKPDGSTFAVVGAPVLLTVGRLAASERYKGQDRVLRLLPALLARYPHLVYAIVGDGDDRPRLQLLADELGVSTHVHFLGHVAPAELPALYCFADLMVMPSTGEGFGIAYLEAMACGTPAIGLLGDGSADALVDGHLGACVNEAGLLDAIGTALDRSRNREALSDKTRQHFGRPLFDAQCRQLAQRLGEAGA
jgi:phosphatidyl-myo-inositol dimannoside synthase